jgi:hypothetical protein
MHEEGPLHYVDVGKWAVWSIFSHAECSAIAKDPRLSAKRAKQMLLPLPLSRQSEVAELARMLALWLIFMDPPEHTRLRKLLNKGFSAAAVEGLRPQVEAIVDQMLRPIKHGSEVELMREFANPMPVRIISELLGVPQELHDAFVSWSRDIAVFRGNPNRTVEEASAAQDALIELTDYFRKTVAERRSPDGRRTLRAVYRAAFRRTRDDSKSHRQRNVHAPAAPANDGRVARKTGDDTFGGGGTTPL